MKILYTNFHTGDGGGHTTYILNLAAALGPRHRVTIAAPRSSRLYLYARQIPGVEVVAMGFRNTLTSMIGTGLALRRLIEKHGFDIVHVNGSADHRIAMLAAMGLGRDSPCIVFTKHNDLPARGVTTWFKGKLGTDSVICVSAYTRRRLAQTVYGRKVNRVVRHGIDLGRFAPVSAAAVSRIRSRFLPGIPEDALVVGSVAGMDDNKGWLDMVTAVAMLPDSLRKRVHIVLAGQLPDATQRSRVAALGMTRQVTYTGMLRDVRPAVALMDVGFVLSQRETLSFACREMMAMGKPVIVSDTGGLPENVTLARMGGWSRQAGTATSHSFSCFCCAIRPRSSALAPLHVPKARRSFHCRLSRPVPRRFTSSAYQESRRWSQKKVSLNGWRGDAPPQARRN